MASNAPEPAPARLEPPYPAIVVNRRARDLRDSHRLRIALLNAAGGRRFKGIARCFSEPPLNVASIILLCESDWGTQRVGNREVAADLAALLHMSFAYGPEWGLPNKQGEIRAYLGNAILSALPFLDVSAVGVPPMSPPSPRRRGTPAGLIAAVQLGTVALTVGVAHLHSRCGPERRDQQMKSYLADFPRHGPAIFGGDLNTTTTELRTIGSIFRAGAQAAVSPARFRSPQNYEPLFRSLAKHGFRIDGANAAKQPTFTFTRFIPMRLRPKLDWLAIRDLKPVPGSARVVPARAALLRPRVSDHDFVILDIEL